MFELETFLGTRICTSYEEAGIQDVKVKSTLMIKGFLAVYIKYDGRPAPFTGPRGCIL